MTKTARYAMFAMLYFAQGAVLSYFTALNSLYLLGFDLTMSQVGLVGTVGLIPLVLKIFLGMLSDRVNLLGKGHRRPYIIMGLLLQAACLLAAPLINPGRQYGLFLGLAFSMMTGMALYDTATDGLALDSTPKEEEGAIQGFMVGGRALGVVLISGVIGILVERTSWTAAFVLLAALSLLPLPFVFAAREPARRPDQKFEWKAFGAFKAWPLIALGLLGAVYSLVINGANQIMNPFLQQRFNISLGTAGLVTTVWGLGVVAGSLAGGKLADRWGHRQAALRAILLSFGSILLLAFVVKSWLVWPLAALFGLAYGFYETVYFAIAMDRTDPRIAASMFSILMAVANLGTGIGLGLAGGLVDSAGFATTFAILAVINLAGLILLPAIFGRRNQAVSLEAV
ncbi:MAG: MFS transporter [Chloroflexi bacterium]|nr:MAG: MFS transporter [Chloroflexota bacterium]